VVGEADRLTGTVRQKTLPGKLFETFRGGSGEERESKSFPAMKKTIFSNSACAPSCARNIATAITLRTFLPRYLILALTLLSATHEGQAQFQRGATQPFSGSVTVINEYKTSRAVIDVLSEKKNGSILLQDKTKRRVLEKKDDSSIANPPHTAPPRAPTKVTVPKKITVDLSAIINQKWQAARADMEAKAPPFFNERAIGPDRGENSFRTSKAHLQMSPTLQLLAGTDGNGFTIRALISGNRMSAYIRTPGAAPEGLDPGFQTQFDLEVTVDVNVQGSRLVASPARLKANVQRPSGKNLTGAAAVVLQNLITELGGPDWIGQLLGVVNGRDFPLSPALTAELAKLSPILSQSSGDVAIMPGYEPGTRSITLTVGNAGTGPIVH
jgi:hypothetical protein